MELLEQMKADRVATLKSGNKIHKQFLTVFLGDLESEAKRGVTITDDLIITKVKKNIQNCQENFDRSGQEQYLQEAEFFKTYLPTMVSDEEIIKFIENSKAAGYTSIGEIMPSLKQTYGKFLDGKRASQLVKEHL
jgi:uncharacterized protein YqeY